MNDGGGRILAAVALAAGLGVACADRDAAAEAEREARARIEAEFGRREAPDTADAPATGGDAAGEVATGGEEVPATTGGGDPAQGPDHRAATAARTEGADEGSPAESRDASGRTTAPSANAGAVPGEVADPPTAGGDAPVETDAPSARADAGSGEVVDQGVETLLARAEAAYAGLDRLRAAFSQRIENPILGRTRDGNGTWLQAGTNLFRMDFAVPAGDLYVADGSCLWLYEPSLHDQVVVSRLEEGVEIGTIDILGRLLAEARSRYDAVDAGVEAVDGAETRVVRLTPREFPARYVEVRLWIGVADDYVRRFRLEEENETVRTVTLTRLEPQAPIEPSQFAFTPPPGVPVFPGDVQCG